MPITNYLPSSRLIQPGVCTSSTRPASPFEGQAIFETDTDRMLIWNGTTWVIPNAPAQNPTGLELAKSQTVGSGVSSVTVSNCFSLMYDAYKIVVSGIATDSLSSRGRIQIGSSSSHRWSLMYSSYNGSFSNLSGSSSTHIDYLFRTSGSYSLNGHVDVVAPFLTQQTQIGPSAYADSGAAGVTLGVVEDNTSHTGITFSCAAGTMTGGTIRVYGYRNS